MHISSICDKIRKYSHHNVKKTNLNDTITSDKVQTKPESYFRICCSVKM